MIELKHACISIDIPLEPMSLDPLFWFNVYNTIMFIFWTIKDCLRVKE